MRNRPDLRERFDVAAAREGFELDAVQQLVADELAELGTALQKRFRRPRGLYLHGPVGRGKSFLVNTFFAEVPVQAKLRVHFHDFFDRLHRIIARIRASNRANAVNSALAELVGGTRLLCFDEFHVHDPGDAALVTKLLRALLARRVALVTTSNYRPADLLPNPLFHHLFQPAIELVEGHLNVVELGGGPDYRRAGGRGNPGFASGTWSTSPPGELRTPTTAERTMIEIDGRPLRASAVRDGLVWFDFDELCATATSTKDYLALAARFSTWVITGVPRLTHRDAEAQQRFANLVDVLSEKDATLHVVAQQDIAGTLACGRDTDRTESRLALLESRS
ncbi:cell division protein ZapE [Saccharopolyspora kobensis]|uniref:Cell division protein ZapE n=1 Tax=Saccharopolyspora kobensis TaxID=146035 RepID=A0A1H6E7D2_9PSEU|nr:cell division protein ZapE [Saccharopolyspora kobensis]SEG92854.1 cell division protein ZapE [Saccharopolyspora kobensis]SFD40770.1 cell division protein ZapE [Saccharopolyspora kobensis]